MGLATVKNTLYEVSMVRLRTLPFGKNLAEDGDVLNTDVA